MRDAQLANANPAKMNAAYVARAAARASSSVGAVETPVVLRLRSICL
jgi:hypothetical protein